MIRQPDKIGDQAFRPGCHEGVEAGDWSEL